MSRDAQEPGPRRPAAGAPAAVERSPFRTLLFGACGLVFVVLLLAGYDASRDLARLKAREAQLEGRLEDVDAGVAELTDRIERLRSDPYTLERVAREELGLSRPGEIVVILPPAPAEAAQEHQAPPRATPATP